MQIISNNFAQIAAALLEAAKEAEQTIADTAVQNIKDHIIANGQVDTGAMLDSVEKQDNGEGSTTVQVNVDYAGYQNYGTKYIAPRPFFEPGLDDTRNNDMDAAMSSIASAMGAA